MSNQSEEQDKKPDTTSSSTPPQEEASDNRGLGALKNHALANKTAMALWFTRGLTLLACLSYLLPFFSSAVRSYQKVLLCNAATSALRLHQRVPNVQLSMAFFSQVMIEDSAHYLVYSLIFMFAGPVTIVLVPIFLFALLNFASYSVNLLDIAGRNNALGSRFFISLIEFQQINMLNLAALIEIFLMPFSVILLFTGQVSLLTPFMYHRFLSMRYSSRRNGYTRNMFCQLRFAAQGVVDRPGMPGILRTLVNRAILTISNMAPAVHTS